MGMDSVTSTRVGALYRCEIRKSHSCHLLFAHLGAVYPLSIGTLLSNSGQTLLSKPAKMGSFWWFSGFLSVAEIFSQTIFSKITPFKDEAT